MKTKFIIVAACLACALTGCEKETAVNQRNEESCELILDVKMPEGVMTKASFTNAMSYETSVSSVQVLVFSKTTGLLEKYVNAGQSLSGISINVTAGDKVVWAVVNGPVLTSVQDIAQLKSTSVKLGQDNGISTSKGMVMSGYSETSLSTSNASCSIKVSRLVSRIVLGTIQNNLPKAYGSLKIISAVLTNVVGNQNIEGSATPQEWYNRYGRADESPQSSTHIIDGSTYLASCPDLTFKAIDATVKNAESHSPSTPYLFYSMPNSSTVAPSAFSTQFKAQRTVLVIKAEFSSQTYFYPVVLDQSVLERNKSYSVSMKITGPGSSDPNTPVNKGDCSVSIVVADWVQGAEYNVSI